MTDYDWSSFRLRIPIKSSISAVYNAWATQNGIESWFLRSSDFCKADGNLRYRDEEVQQGDTYTWLWYGYEDEVVEKGRMLEANGSSFFHFTFSGMGDNNITVSVNIGSEENETIVELVQQDIPLDDASRALYHIGCMQGWTFYLANLKSILEGGIDLRNKNVKLQNMLNS